MLNDVFSVVGKTLAQAFHIEKVIAEGGFGVVYRAEHVKFRAPVAVKCLKVPATMDAEQEAQFIERFRSEAEILFHLSAAIPEVVRPLHADTFKGPDGNTVPYLALEWIDGEPLDAILVAREYAKQSMPTLLETMAMLDPIAHALDRAHHFRVPGGAVVSVIHCDLKPENIIITPAESPVRAKILDYGIAKTRALVMQSAGRISESEGNNPFTPSYGSPEQWVPKRYGQSGPWTDVWGLAITMVECLIGRPPIQGDMHAMMGTALDPGRRPTPGTEGVNVSAKVEAVFQKALAVDPRKRFKTIADFWTELQRSSGVKPTFAEQEVPSLRLEREAASEPAPPGGAKAPAVGPDAPGNSPTGATQARSAQASPYPEKAKPPVSTGPHSKPFRTTIDLDLSDPAPSSAVSNMRIAKPPQPEDLPSSQPRVAIDTSKEANALGKQLRLPIQLFCVGVALTLAGALSKKLGFGALALGPVKLSWIAAACAGSAVLLAFLSFIREVPDEP